MSSVFCAHNRVGERLLAPLTPPKHAVRHLAVPVNPCMVSTRLTQGLFKIIPTFIPQVLIAQGLVYGVSLRNCPVSIRTVCELPDFRRVFPPLLQFLLPLSWFLPLFP